MAAIILLLLLVATTYDTYVVAFKEISIAEFKARPISEFAMQLTGQELIDYINANQPFFKAAESKLSQGEFKSRLMHKKYLKVDESLRIAEQYSNEDIPESFDAREKWPQCESIQTVRDQANCGSCWAVSSASAMSDRLCVATKGRNQAFISDTDILACCKYCGDGCDGGYMIDSWQFLKTTGACTGGLYVTRDNCKPYAFHPCGHHENQTFYGECEKDNEDTPTCRAKCQLGYSKTYLKDKIQGKSAYYVANNVQAIQREIMSNGPVQAAFTVYSDFAYYKSGIYVHTAGKDEGGHAIKIIGWGVEKGVPYWTVANSWNSDWGEKGHFRILRGSNECGIEEEVTAGLLRV